VSSANKVFIRGGEELKEREFINLGPVLFPKIRRRFLGVPVGAENI